MKIPLVFRVLIALSAIALLLLNVLPIWRIDLMAPQYPEGLFLQIFSDRFSGDVEKINGLNHYIGMAVIKNEMFPEFTYLPKVIIGLAVLGSVMALWGELKSAIVWLLTLVLFGLWALYDMYRWGYDYGHNLDPHAAIKIDDMAYQPPLIGHKQLLNFDAWSTPDIGGWILFGVMGIALISLYVTWRKTLNLAPRKALS